MASLCLSASSAVMVAVPPSSTPSTSSPTTHIRQTNFKCFLSPINIKPLRCCPVKARGGRFVSHVVCMAPEEEKMTRRSPLDFPIEWERPKPGRRPDIFPQFSPMKTPLPPPMPADPPEEDVEEEEKKEEEEEDPEKEEQENPEK